MALTYFRILNNEFLNKYLDVVPEQAHIIILDKKSSVCMSKNGNDTKHTIHISRTMHFVKHGKECNMHKKVWCEGGLKLSDIGTKNFREDGFNTRLEYDMVRLDK